MLELADIIKNDEAEPFETALDNLKVNLPYVVEALLAKAKNGDVSAAKLLYKDMMAILQPQEAPVDVMGMLDEYDE
ncbi:hypothetical protein ISS30_01695 [bacterium]|nr:hypothetical protein [bacterium]